MCYMPLQRANISTGYELVYPLSKRRIQLFFSKPIRHIVIVWSRVDLVRTAMYSELAIDMDVVNISSSVQTLT